MKTNLFYFMFACLTLSMLIVSCSVEDGVDGVVGAQGIQGPSGVDGVNGTDGVDGMNGQDGNANVVSSDWIPLAEYDSIAGYFGEMTLTYTTEFNYTIPELDQTTLNTGIVLVFAKLNDIDLYEFQNPDNSSELVADTTQITNFPVIRSYTEGPADATANETWSSEFTDGNLKLKFNLSFTNQIALQEDEFFPEWEEEEPSSDEVINFMLDDFFGGTVTSFRYVIIPATGSAKSAPSALRKMSYEEVIEHFNLKL